MIFLLLMFWKKKGIDYNSPEFWAIEAGAKMIGHTGKRYLSPDMKCLSYLCPLIDGASHYIYSTSAKFSLVTASHHFPPET